MRRSERRIAALDYWRALAILLVVFWHYYPVTVELGRIGVRLFFVLSGFLVSRPLIEAKRADDPLPWRIFANARARRILPSYYFFLLAATGLLSLFVLNAESGTLISYDGWPSFLFFYKNYNQLAPAGFGHLWSLCVEEHFYLLLPLLFAIVPRIGLLFTLVLLIGAQVAFRAYLALTSGFDPAATHVNLDCLLVGVVLRYAYSVGWRPLLPLARISVFTLGLVIIVVSAYFGSIELVPFHNLVTMRFVESAAFALMIAATLDLDSRFFHPLRILSRYSYNWYLWHVPALIVVQTYLSVSIPSFGAYLFLSLSLAMIATHMIEDRFHRRANT